MTRNAPNRAVSLAGLALILALSGCGSSSSGGSTMQPDPDPDPDPGPTGGLDGRPSNTTCTAPPRPGTGASIETQRAFQSYQRLISLTMNDVNRKAVTEIAG